jgi:hypothetical protein
MKCNVIELSVREDIHEKAPAHLLGYLAGLLAIACRIVIKGTFFAIINGSLHL